MSDQTPTIVLVHGAFAESTSWNPVIDGRPTDTPAWRHRPSWFVLGNQDLNIPVALQRFMSDYVIPMPESEEIDEPKADTSYCWRDGDPDGDHD